MRFWTGVFHDEEMVLLKRGLAKVKKGRDLYSDRGYRFTRDEQQFPLNISSH